MFELKYPLISTLAKISIEHTGVSAERESNYLWCTLLTCFAVEEEVEVKPDEKINLMEASGFLKRSRHKFSFESKLTEEQKESFKQLFLVYDKDGSGTIDVNIYHSLSTR